MSIINMLERIVQDEEKGRQEPPHRYAAFGQYVQARMRELNLTIAQLAARMKVSPTTSLRNIVLGKAYPAKKTLGRLVAALELDNGHARKLLGKKKQRALKPGPKPRPVVPDVTSTASVNLETLADGKARLRMNVVLPLEVAIEVLTQLKEGKQ